MERVRSLCSFLKILSLRKLLCVNVVMYSPFSWTPLFEEVIGGRYCMAINYLSFTSCFGSLNIPLSLLFHHPVIRKYLSFPFLPSSPQKQCLFGVALQESHRHESLLSSWLSPTGWFFSVFIRRVDDSGVIIYFRFRPSVPLFSFPCLLSKLLTFHKGLQWQLKRLPCWNLVFVFPLPGE